MPLLWAQIVCHLFLKAFVGTSDIKRTRLSFSSTTERVDTIEKVSDERAEADCNGGASQGLLRHSSTTVSPSAKEAGEFADNKLSFCFAMIGF